jgi:hypothetical protein
MTPVGSPCLILVAPTPYVSVITTEIIPVRQPLPDTGFPQVQMVDAVTNKPAMELAIFFQYDGSLLRGE